MLKNNENTPSSEIFVLTMRTSSDNIRYASLPSVPVSRVRQGEIAVHATKYREQLHQGVYLFMVSLHFMGCEQCIENLCY